MRVFDFIRFLLISGVLITFPPPNPAHVVFEEFGTMAGSVSYMHVTLHINLSHVDNLINEYKRTTGLIQDTLGEQYHVAMSRASNHTKDLIYRHHLIATQVIEIHNQAADDAGNEIKHLRGVLPPESTQFHPGRMVYRENRSVKDQVVSKAAGQILEVLKKRGMNIPVDLLKITKGVSKATKIFRGISPLSMGFSIAKGIFGTFMGLYNVFQMEKLRRDLNGVIQQQNKVIEVLEDHQIRLDFLHSELDQLKLMVKTFESYKLPSLQSQLSRSLNIIKTEVKQAVHAVQQAHHHRLAIDYFDAETLQDIYDTIAEQAKAARYRLLTRFPSDLFQLEVSYMFDNKDVVLFLHVPLVPEDSLLTLYRLKPFPIPFSETRALLPRPSTALLALANKIPRAITHIDHSDLVDCHQVNQIYLCERHGVLLNQIKSSCLGALFEQDIPAAQQICDLELVPYAESVLQLKNNWFLVYSPTMFTAYMKCLNETTDAKAVQVGVQQFYVDPSCQLELKNHSLTSELSMKLDVEVTYFPWKFADLKAFSVTEEDITAALEGRTTSGERNLFLADVMQHKHFSSKIPPWQLVTSGLIITAILVGMVLLVSLVGTHRIVAFRRRMRRIRNAVENIQPHRIPSRPPSRRHSEREDLLPAAPPMYPGLPNEEQDHEQEYEMMAFNPENLSQGLQQLSRAASRISRISRLSQNSLFRSVSLPPPSEHSRKSSRAASRRSSTKSKILTAHSDDDNDDKSYDNFMPTSAAKLFSRSTSATTSPPTPAPRSRTPSYVFLKATAQDE
jgi:hypothetical protein